MLFTVILTKTLPVFKLCIAWLLHMYRLHRVLIFELSRTSSDWQPTLIGYNE